MRPGLVRHVGLGIGALALVWLTACDDNPLSFDVKDSARIVTNPAVMVISAGRTGQLRSSTVNESGAPTYEQIAAAVDPTCGPAAITVAEDTLDAQLVRDGVVPPGRFRVAAGATLGQSCVVLTSGSLTATVDVTVVGEAITIISAPDLLRAGEGGQVVAGLVDFDGNPVGPYDPADAGWSSQASNVADFVDDIGNFTTEVAGSAPLTVTWIGQEGNGTVVEGVVLEATHVVTVVPNVPDSAAFAGAFDAMEVDEEQTVEVIVYDALSNVNTNADELTGPCTVTSSNELVATATCGVIPGAEPTDPVSVEVVLTSVGPGTADIGGTLVTTAGTVAFGPSTVTVIAPSITSLSVASGGYAETVTINGVGFVAEGFITLVYSDGEQLGNFTVVSDTEITAQMGTYNVAGAHLITVEVAGIASNSTAWTQTDACNANDLSWTPGPPLYGPIVDVSIPLRCNGTATDADNSNSWFVAPISEDALGGGTDVSVNYASTWGPPLKDIDWYYCGDGGMTPSGPVGSCAFEIDQPPETVDLDLGVGDHVFMQDDYASYTSGNSTPQPYTVVVTINE